MYKTVSRGDALRASRDTSKQSERACIRGPWPEIANDGDVNPTQMAQQLS